MKSTFGLALIGALLISLGLGCGSHGTLLGSVRAKGHGGWGGGGGGGRQVGRILTTGYEIGNGNTLLEGGTFDGTIVNDTSIKHSGAQSIKIVGAPGVESAMRMDLIDVLTAPGGTTPPYYLRFYLYVDAVPGPVDFPSILQVQDNAGTAICNVVLDPTTLTYRSGDDATIFASSSYTTGQWYRVEISFNVVAGSVTGELRVDGVSKGSGTGFSGGNGSLRFLNFAVLASNGCTIHIDDMGLNDSAGTQQNAWPGDGKIVLLKPISDHARTGWVTGAGGTTNLWQAVSNTPPIGSSTETATSQIKDIVKSATDNYDANMTSYSTAGLIASDTITLVQAVVDEGVRTATVLNGALQIVSNPAQAVEESFTYSSFNFSSVGAWPATWDAFYGKAQYSPTVVLGTSPVLRVGKRTSSASEVDVDFMGIYVEYTSGGALAATSHRQALLGVGH